MRGLAWPVRLNQSVTRSFATGGSNSTSDAEAQKRLEAKEEMRKRYDEEQEKIAEEKRKQAEEQRLVALGKIIKRSGKPRVPDFVKPWQKVWFPNERVILVKPERLDVTATDLVFRVPPHLTKHEIKDMLEAVYGFDVKKVTTVNRLGKIKYPAGFSMVASKAYRRPDFKQAYVKLNSPDFRPQPSNQLPREVRSDSAQPESKTE